MKTIALLAVRLGSSRLPGKALMPILGKPMLEHMIDRIRFSRHIDEIMMATSVEKSDDQLEMFAEEVGIQCFRGSLDDVLGRLNAAVASTDADLVVEMLGDNPLVHSELIDDVIDYYLDSQVDYAANTTIEYPLAPPDSARFPVGIRVQVFSPEVLSKCEMMVIDPEHREHSTSFIYEHPEIFKLGYFDAVGKWADLHRPDLTFAVNYAQNFELVKTIIEQSYLQDENFSLHKVIENFDASPSLRSLMGPPNE